MQLWLIPTLDAIASVAAGLPVPRPPHRMPTHAGLRAPRVAAVAGILFSVLLLAMLFAGAVIPSFRAAPNVLINSATFQFGRGLAVAAILLIGSCYIDWSLVNIWLTTDEREVRA